MSGNSLRLAAASVNTTPLDWRGNRKKIVGCIRGALSEGVDILCLPELCISGYGCEDMFLAPETARVSREILDEIAAETAGIFVCAGLPVLYRGALFNAVASMKDGEVLSLHAKANLAGDGVHYEQRWFRPWALGSRVDSGGTPLGDMVVNAGGVRIGYEICEDAWVASRPGSRLSSLGVEVMLNPSASHFAMGKMDVRRRLVLEGSRAFHCAYVYSNLHGNESGRMVYDGSLMIAANGEMLACAPRFPQGDTSLCFADINLDLIRARSAASASRTVETSECPGELKCPGFRPCHKSPPPRFAPQEWESGPHVREEEFTRAMAVALRDYMKKSGTSGFVVSLSGGADSAAVCCLIFYMECLYGGRSGARERVNSLLTTVYQATAQSSLETMAAAADVASALGARHSSVDIGRVLETYGELFVQTSDRPLSWERDDVAMQNIQARARAPLAWLLANTENKLLLATSNRSEAAVGYATMDGDTCGSLSPLAGVGKTFLLSWLKWAQSVGPAGIGPVPELARVTSRPPSAELRPASENQLDERDLMPYDILGEIENLLIGDRLSSAEAERITGERHPEIQPGTVRGWVRKFLSLWRRNQWKRERYAPAFHMDDKNLDPRSWCRYPLLSPPEESKR